MILLKGYFRGCLRSGIVTCITRKTFLDLVPLLLQEFLKFFGNCYFLWTFWWQSINLGGWWDRLLLTRLLSGPETLSLSRVWPGCFITSTACFLFDRHPAGRKHACPSIPSASSVTHCGQLCRLSHRAFQSCRWSGKPRWETFSQYILFLFCFPNRILLPSPHICKLEIFDRHTMLPVLCKG